MVVLANPRGASDLRRFCPNGSSDDPIGAHPAREILNDPRHRLVVAIDDDAVVGFVSAVLYVHPDKAMPELRINEVGVAPATSGAASRGGC